MPFDGETACSDNVWYLVHCQPRKETYAADSLRHLLKLHVFLPESKIGLRGSVKYTPFFPGYIFVRANLQKHPVSRINTCPGVLRLVEFGGHPQSVPSHVIEIISQQLERLNAQPHQNFNPGDKVQIKNGPLQNLEMVFVRPSIPSQRVYVLLDILGRLTEVQVDVGMLEKCPGSSDTVLQLHPQRLRYTRGKGRKIHYRAEATSQIT